MEVDDIVNDSVDPVEFVERDHPADISISRVSVDKDTDTTPGPAVAPVKSNTNWATIFWSESNMEIIIHICSWS